MNNFYPGLFFFIFLLNSLIAAFVGILVLVRRDKHIVHFGLMMLALAWWSLAAGLGIVGRDLQYRILMAKLEYIGTITFPPFLLIFALTYTKRVIIRKAILKVVIWLLPLITILLVFSNGIHQLVWNGYSPVDPLTNIVIFYHGPWFWVVFIYSYINNTVAAALLLHYAFRISPKDSRPITFLVFTFIIPAIGGIIYGFDLFPIKGFEITPIGFMFASLLIYWGFFRHQLFDIFPATRNSLMEAIHEGIFVFDKSNQLVDINSAGLELLGLDNDAIGRSVEQVFDAEPILVSLITNKLSEIREYQLKSHSQPIYINAKMIPVSNKSDTFSGNMLVIHNVTADYQAKLEAEQKLRQEVLEQQRQEVAKDLHDSLMQSIYSSALTLENTKDMAEAGLHDKVRAMLNKLETNTWQIIKEMRLLVFQWRSQQTSSQGLYDELKTRLSLVEERAGLSITLDIDGTLDLTSEQDRNLTAILMEALNNIIKHAYAKNIEITIKREANQFQMKIKDDGRGFEPDSQESVGFGISIMQERAKEIGASLIVDSHVGEGTLVKLVLPERPMAA